MVADGFERPASDSSEVNRCRPREPRRARGVRGDPEPSDRPPPRFCRSNLRCRPIRDRRNRASILPNVFPAGHLRRTEPVH